MKNLSKTKLLNMLVKEICAREKGKKQMNAGQAREVLKTLAGMMRESEFDMVFYTYVEMAEKKK